MSEGRYVIVVGSSARLRGKGLGKQIDGYDMVARINAAPVLGHEGDVGSRTTHRFVPSMAIAKNENVKKPNHPYSLEQLQGVELLSDIRPRVHRDYWDDLQSTFRVSRSDYKRPLEWVEEVTNTRFGKMPWISTGFKAILHFLDDGPAICGFDYTDLTPQGLTHYWDDKIGGLALHKWTEERKAISCLIKLGHIEAIDD